MMRRWGRAAAVVMAGAAIGACRDRPRRNDVTTDTPTLRETATGAKLTDPGIVVLVNGIHGSEISTAQAALQRLQDPAARAYATAMVQEHQASRQELQAVPVKAESAMVAPPQVATMQAVSKSEAQLMTLMPSGPAYDRLYVTIQVADHSTALDSLRQWEQVASDGALKQYLAGTAGHVQEHLSRAQALLAGMGGSATPGAVLPPPPDTAWFKDGAPGKVDSLRRAQGARRPGAPSAVVDTTHTAPAPKPPVRQDTARKGHPRP